MRRASRSGRGGARPRTAGVYHRRRHERPARSANARAARRSATGPIDILVNNVGGRRGSIPIEETPVETWLRIMDLNLTGCFICTKVIGGAMIAHGGGGRIINIASIECAHRQPRHRRPPL